MRDAALYNHGGVTLNQLNQMLNQFHPYMIKCRSSDNANLHVHILHSRFLLRISKHPNKNQKKSITL